ncbi:MAG: M20 family metallopeptidase [Planctomycetes bacterium]|nr:M20 family metallopeptidase [Planctomycetota bacterium]
MTQTRQYLDARVEAFNANLKGVKLEAFEWKKTVDNVDYWVFGYRLGSGLRTFSVLTHLDTVPAGSSSWEAFTPEITQHRYRGIKQTFLVGRGSIDNKGPSVAALTVFETAAKQYSQSDELNDWTLELVFDTSEETDPSIPHYYDDIGEPDFGIVFDAFWCIRAEKGVERPRFSMPLGTAPSTGLWISDFSTPSGPTNQIADTASAQIESDDPVALQSLADSIETLYANYAFDDETYHSARLETSLDNNILTLTTFVEGAQHGSAPDQNRDYGANPVVSLAVFLAGLIEQETLSGNYGFANMVQFIDWSFGTFVFGEKHPDLLKREDSVFGEGNGTTYAITRVDVESDTISIRLDIRYTQGHHETEWDGVSSGSLSGTSLFLEYFTDLTDQYNALYQSADLTFTTSNLVPPDIRNTESEQFQHVNLAYREVTGEDCPAYAVGGWTDAKGKPTLFAAGALFDPDFGDPINFHGINEAAPVDDLRLSTQILYNILVRTVE